MTAVRQVDIKPRLSLGNLTPVARWLIRTLYFLSICSEVGSLSYHSLHSTCKILPWLLQGLFSENHEKNSQASTAPCLCAPWAPAIEPTKQSVVCDMEHSLEMLQFEGFHRGAEFMHNLGILDGLLG